MEGKEKLSNFSQNFLIEYALKNEHESKKIQCDAITKYVIVYFEIDI